MLASGAGARLAPEEVAAVRKVFALYDPNGSGLIETKELQWAMLQLGMELPEEHMKKLKASLAEDNTRMMDLPSFTELLSQQKPYMLDPLTHTQLAWLGLEGNEDYSGTVPVKALKEKLQLIGAELPDLDTFLEEHALDQSEGVLSWADFHALMAVEGDEDDPFDSSTHGP